MKKLFLLSIGLVASFAAKAADRWSIYDPPMVEKPPAVSGACPEPVEWVEPPAVSGVEPPVPKTGTEIRAEVLALRLESSSAKISLLRPSIAISYRTFKWLLVRTSVGTMLSELQYSAFINESLAVNLTFQGLGGVFFAQGLELHSPKWRGFSLMVFGDLEYLPLAPSTRIKNIEFSYPEQTAPVGTMLADHLKVKYRHERYDFGGVVQFESGAWRAFLTIGVMSLDAALEVMVDDELATLLQNQSVRLEPTYKMQAIRPFWAVGGSYAFAERWFATLSATTLSIAPLSLGAQTSLTYQF